MTGLHGALQAFWGGFTYGTAAIKAYEQGNVPSTATYPYITYEAAEGAYWGATILTAFVWVKKATGVDWQVQRAAILDLIKAAIPEGGTHLDYADGNLFMRRNPTNFMSYYNDPNDASVVGGRISYEATYYTL
ncbi:MAG TPA: hypothetical protein PLM48_08085 [Clostridia bacterium]|nr:hypothetical protein [Clostridia bacterium]